MSDEWRDSLRALADAERPNDLASGRVVRRAERTLDLREAPRRSPLLVGGALVVSGFVAALLLVGPDATDADPAPDPAAGSAFTTAGPPAPGARPADTPDPAEPSVLLYAEAASTLAPTATLSLTYTGRGTLRSPSDHPRIDWDAGELAVEVTPDRGVDLVVETAEGTASVIGTGFTVTRDALGTEVAVAHGTVAVRCRDGREARLGGGQSLLCLPVRGSGMLARARALDRRGEGGTDVLEALDAGLRLEPDSGPVRAELAARRIRTLAQLGREDDAAAAAAAWLAGDDRLRRDEVRALAAGLALRRHDCAAALQLADPAAPFDAATRISLADCAAPSDPGRARGLLEAARVDAPERASDIDARLREIP